MQTSLPDHKKRQQRIELAEAGDPWALYRAIRAENGVGLDWGTEFDPFLRALEKCAREAPDLFAAELLSQLMAGAAYLSLRTQMRVEYEIQQADERGRYQPGPYLPDSANHCLIPRLLEIGRYTAEIALVQAKLARQWALARAKQRGDSKVQWAAKRNGDHKQAPTNGRPKLATKRSNGTAAPHLNGNGHRLSLPTFRR